MIRRNFLKLSLIPFLPLPQIELIEKDKLKIKLIKNTNDFIENRWLISKGSKEIIVNQEPWSDLIDSHGLCMTREMYDAVSYGFDLTKEEKIRIYKLCIFLHGNHRCVYNNYKMTNYNLKLLGYYVGRWNS